ncbi:PH domain-containing protein [Halobacteriaceae archaeon GCM10025711]
MESLNPRVRIVWVVAAATTALVLGGVLVAVDAFLVDIGGWVGPLVFGLVVAVGGVFAVLRYRIWGFELRDDSLFISRGVLTRVRTVVPFVRVQHVDTQRGPVERVVGLSSVVVYTAGSRGADVTIPGLTPERADALQERLRRLAIESEAEDAV